MGGDRPKFVTVTGEKREERKKIKTREREEKSKLLSIGSENEPAELLLPYLQRADKLQKHEHLVAYYCRLYAMECILKIPAKEQIKMTSKLIVSLMNQLEKVHSFATEFFCFCSPRVQMEVKDSMTARKVQKVDREKLRRDRLNEQFLELGKALASRSQSASKQDSNDVATELELKTPGSSLTTHLKSVPDQELSSEGRKGKHWSSPRKGSAVTDESCSSRCSSSRAPQDSSSNSVGDGSMAKK